MKGFLLCAIACTVIVGCSRAHTAPPAVPGPAGKVFLHSKGPDREVERFRKIFAIAMEDHDLVGADTAEAADAVVKAEVKQEESIHYLYAPVVHVGLTSRKGESYLLQSCSIVSNNDDVFGKPVTRINLPLSWKKEHSAISSIYINHAGFKNSENLVQVLTDSLREQGYRLVSDVSEADAQLSGIGLVKLEIPMRTVDRGVHYEVFDKTSHRYAYSDSGFGSVAYMGPRDLIDPKLPCAINGFGDGGQRYWSEANLIANAIQEHLKHTKTQ